jgi:pimeloyl-ACP methyl ester carboxylesterase
MLAVQVADTARDDSMAAIARRVLAAAPPRFALAGISMGGYVAFEILRQAPERVERLALIATTARPDTPEQSEKRTRAIELAASGGFPRIAAGTPAQLLSAPHRDDPALAGLVEEMALAVGADAFIRQQRAILGRPDSRPDLAAIACPTLVLVGADDPLGSPERATEMAEAIRDARLAIISDCGHLTPIERPDETTAHLKSWLGM